MIQLTVAQAVPSFPGMTAMNVLDVAVVGVLASVVVAIFYRAFWRRPTKHRLGGEVDWDEVDYGTPEELGIRDELGAAGNGGLERD